MTSELIYASKQHSYKSGFDTEMKQDEHSTARPTLKRWSNRNPTAELRIPHPAQDVKRERNINTEDCIAQFMQNSQPFPPSPVFSRPLGISKPISVHSLMLSYQLFYCLHLRVFPWTVCSVQSCFRRAIWSWDVAIRYYHLSFRWFTMARRSSCTPICFRILLRIS